LLLPSVGETGLEQQMSTGERSLRLEARTIPTPTSISVEARAALERLIGTDGVPLTALFELPAHDDLAGWEKVKAAVDANYARMLAAASEVPEATVATTRLNGALVHVATPADVIASEAVYLELHGGALVFGAGDACRHGARVQADQLGVTVWTIACHLSTAIRRRSTTVWQFIARRWSVTLPIVSSSEAARRGAIWRPRCCCVSGTKVC
jgi:hypothetical protein